MITLTFFNHAGGVGKSSSVRDIGYVLSEFGYKVLLIDTDPQANLTDWLGITEPIDLSETIFPAVISQGVDYKQLKLPEPKRSNGLDVIPSQVDLAKLDVLMMTEINPLLRLRNAIQKLNLYDFVLIDPPPSLGQISALSMIAADRVIVPLPTNNKGLRGIKTVVEMVNRYSELNPRLKIGMFLLTQFDPRTNHDQNALSAIKQQLKGFAPVSTPLHYRPAIYKDTQIAGLPIPKYRPNEVVDYEIRVATTDLLTALGEKVANMSSAVLNRADAFSSILGMTTRSSSRQIALEDIVVGPAQPRVHFDPTSLQELTESIKQHGVLQPILVRERGQKYELIAGERRFRAAQQAGLESIPAVIRDLHDDEAFEIALLENLNREDLNPLEETDGILRLLASKLKLSREEVIERLRIAYYLQRGRNVTTHVDTHEIELIKQTFVTLGRLNITSFYNHRLPILDLPQDLLERVRKGELEYPEATALGRIKEQETREALTQQVIANGLSHEETLQAIQGLTSNSKANPKSDLFRETKKLLSPVRFKKLDATKQRRVEKLLTELQQLLK